MKRVLERRGKSREEAAFYVGVGTTTFDSLVGTGQMPQPRVVGTRTIWDHHELDDFFDRLPQRAGSVLEPMLPKGGAVVGEINDWNRMRP